MVSKDQRREFESLLAHLRTVESQVEFETTAISAANSLGLKAFGFFALSLLVTRESYFGSFVSGWVDRYFDDNHSTVDAMLRSARISDKVLNMYRCLTHIEAAYKELPANRVSALHVERLHFSIEHGYENSILIPVAGMNHKRRSAMLISPGGTDSELDSLLAPISTDLRILCQVVHDVALVKFGHRYWGRKEITDSDETILYLLGTGTKRSEVCSRLKISERTLRRRLDALRSYFQVETDYHLFVTATIAGAISDGLGLDRGIISR